MLFLLLLGILLAWYLLYYKKYVAGPPEVICSSQARKRELEKYCPALFQTFYPTIWAPLAYMQTVGRALLQTYPRHPRRREKVSLSDYGHVCLDWYNENSPTQPTLIILSGITGSSDENYVRHMIDDMVQQDYSYPIRCIVFNYRGCGGSKLSNTKMYCGANIEDLMEVLEHIHTVIPDSPLIAVGVCFGSTQLIKYLSECKRIGKDCYLKAILLISTLWDMTESQKCFNRFFNRHTLIRFLSFKFIRVLKENSEIFEDALKKEKLCFDYHKAVKATSLLTLAEVMVLPMFGYSSVEDYFRDLSPCHRLDGIIIPVIALNSADDPVSPAHSLPYEEARSNPNLILVTTKRGGHAGFIDSFFPLRKCLMDRIVVQFANAVFEHDFLSTQ